MTDLVDHNGYAVQPAFESLHLLSFALKLLKVIHASGKICDILIVTFGFCLFGGETGHYIYLFVMLFFECLNRFLIGLLKFQKVL